MFGFLANLVFGGGADNASDLLAMVDAGALVVDVRTAGEYSGGNISGSINISHDLITRELPAIQPDKSRPIVVYCLSGSRSASAKRSLKRAGYEQVLNGGGLRNMRKVFPGR